MEMASTSAAADKQLRRKKRSLANVAGFVLGVPVAVGLLAAFHFSELKDTLAGRYLRDPIEWAEVVLFCVAAFALLARYLGQRRVRAVFNHEILPEWDGTPVPVTDANQLQVDLRYLGRRWQNTYLVRRVSAILDFVRHRNSANGIDDQMRALSDNDAMALDGSHSLLRFIVWAIPILGFLGTVLGIAGAVTGLTPEVLERELSKVTDGLALAFDTTALALALTMILMFMQHLVERVEQGTFEAIDQYMDIHLAHRFERGVADSNNVVPIIEQNTERLFRTIEKVVQRQADIWADTLEKADHHWAEQTERQQQQFNAVLESALDKVMVKHTQRIREIQEALNWVTEKMAAQVNTLEQIQENDGHLARTQDLLQKNLATLANSNTFDETMQSLTAAIHLLTARSGGQATVAMPIRPAKAA